MFVCLIVILISFIIKLVKLSVSHLNLELMFAGNKQPSKCIELKRVTRIVVEVKAEKVASN